MKSTQCSSARQWADAATEIRLAARSLRGGGQEQRQRHRERERKRLQEEAGRGEFDLIRLSCGLHAHVTGADVASCRASYDPAYLIAIRILIGWLSPLTSRANFIIETLIWPF